MDAFVWLGAHPGWQPLWAEEHSPWMRSPKGSGLLRAKAAKMVRVAPLLADGRQADSLSLPAVGAASMRAT